MSYSFKEQVSSIDNIYDWKSSINLLNTVIFSTNMIIRIRKDVLFYYKGYDYSFSKLLIKVAQKSSDDTFS